MAETLAEMAKHRTLALREPRKEDKPDGRVAYGVPYRVGRLRCLGNAVVPAQAYPIFLALRKELET